jgi:hypothetical protein
MLHMQSTLTLCYCHAPILHVTVHLEVDVDLGYTLERDMLMLLPIALTLNS